jgi:hypothetical protein
VDEDNAAPLEGAIRVEEKQLRGHIDEAAGNKQFSGAVRTRSSKCVFVVLAREDQAVTYLPRYAAPSIELGPFPVLRRRLKAIEIFRERHWARVRPRDHISRFRLSS